MVFWDIDSGIVFTFDTHIGKVIVAIIIVLVTVIAMLFVASGTIAEGAFLAVASTSAVVVTTIVISCIICAHGRRSIEWRRGEDRAAHVAPKSLLRGRGRGRRSTMKLTAVVHLLVIDSR